jgi:hypothetical protein
MKFLNQKTSAAALSLALLATPLLASAAGGILTGVCPNAPDCTFNDILILSNNVIKFLLFSVSVPLAALGFVWVGANLILSQNKTSAWSDAKGRFADIAMGFGIMLGSYILIKTVIFSFLTANQQSYMQFMFK